MRRYGPFRRALAAMAIAGALIIGAGTAAHADPGIQSPYNTRITLDMSECDLMYLGTAGSCIISLQTWMNWAVGTKQTRIPVDGLYTERTRALVVTFQQRYVPSVIPNGKFGTRSRAALRQWFETKSARSLATHGTGLPCNTALGWGCDIGAAVPGLNPSTEGKVGKSVFCGGLGALAPGPYGIATGVFCDLVLD
ncbi:hypothetical protein KOI35_14955 [Actinoplanes bogorensis]|uniref:Peptidoglycan binding-like domain-containing protein n=1 Tax=Paractinoplanes bogorensis TaxID=1610840 RepID=A0ABS5YMV3_9ACTN|nr:hypothetical protein [Actinoplanes bogorensis]MBU2664799.1 hypothetical protein [Actinoplanes bogorensis]